MSEYHKNISLSMSFILRFISFSFPNIQKGPPSRIKLSGEISSLKS